MKSLLKILSPALVAIVLSGTASASQIQGSITFNGGITLDTATVSTATTVTSWVSPIVQSSDGDFAGLNGTAVSLYAPWTFNTPAPGIVDFWQVGGFHFDLTSSSIAYQGLTSLIVQGTGVIYGNRFDPTTGVWNFSTQNPSAGGTFSFSAATTAVPEGGTTALLAGAAMIIFAAIGSRRSRTADAVVAG